MKRKFFMNWNQFYFISILTVLLISVTVVIPKYVMDLEYKACSNAYAQDPYKSTDLTEESGGIGRTTANLEGGGYGGQKISAFSSGSKLHETTLQLLEAGAESQIIEN